MPSTLLPGRFLHGGKQRVFGIQTRAKRRNRRTARAAALGFRLVLGRARRDACEALCRVCARLARPFRQLVCPLKVYSMIVTDRLRYCSSGERVEH